jgi:hypothetical protein
MPSARPSYRAALDAATARCLHRWRYARGASEHRQLVAQTTLPQTTAWVWVAETSSPNEVVDSAGFVLKLISHVRDCLRAPALPLVLPSSETRTGLGKLGPPAPDRGAQPAGAQAQTAGQRPVVLGGLERMVAKLACRVNNCSTRDRHRLATSRVQAVLVLEVPASRRTTPKGCRAD